jgi:TonB family protein
MSAALVWSNAVAYTLQIGLVVGLGALVSLALRLRSPRLRLLYWQTLLLACLALPWVRSWRREVVDGAAQVSVAITTMTTQAPSHRTIPLVEIALLLLAAGVTIRLALLCVGLVQLKAFRERGRTLPSAAGTGYVRLLLSDDVASPVTFGWREPVVLLPAGFPSLAAEMREAILCHELLHVARRDWLFTIAEELVRAVLWFHPAIWWVIGEIQLAREQTVDRAVIETTRAHGPYVDALLLMAGAGVPGTPQLDLAPAPMFLRRRHLKKRLMEAMSEVQMTTISRTRMVCFAGVAAVTLALACWLATGAFPLSAAPQVVNDAAGVAVNLNGTPLMHRASVPYPSEALAKGVEGTVVVQVKLDANGEVADATVLSGPDELRKAVLQSVLTWHFDKSAALTARTVNVDFAKPAVTAAPGTSAEAAQLTEQLLQLQRQATAARAASAALAPPPPPPPPPPTSGKLDHIAVTGLSDSARAELLSRLPIQEGGEWTAQTFAAVRQAVTQFDSHLMVSLSRSANGELSLRIGLAATTVTGGSGLAGSMSAVAAAPGNPPGVFSVGNGVSAPRLLLKVDPAYPEGVEDSKDPRTVQLSIVVNTDGKAENIQVVKSVDPAFDASAINAIQQWTFQPGMNNGAPVKVKAMVEVNFRKL